MFKNRYLRNKILSEENQQLLKESKVVIFGMGGLGGYVAEGLTRIGIGELVLIDYDVFSESNLNRQRFSYEDNIGKKKVLEAKKELGKINSEIKIEAIDKKLSDNEIDNLLSDEKISCVVDCLDNIKDRLILESICAKKNKVLIHGSISGWVGEVATIYPNDNILQNIYVDDKNVNDKKTNEKYGNIVFVASFIASIQVARVVKYIIGEKNEHGKVAYFDLKHNDYDFVI